MKLSAFLDEYAKDLDGQIEAAHRWGIEYVELRYINEKNVSLWSSAEAREIRKRLDDCGLSVSAIGSPLGKVRLEGDLSEHLETARRVFEIANIMETKFVRMFSFYMPQGKNIAGMKGEVLHALERMLLLAREYGVTLCHENEAGIYGDTPERCKEILDHFGGELKCVFDMGNFVLEGVEPQHRAYPLLKEYIAYFHIKDALAAGAIVPPGKGEARIGEILRSHAAETTEDFFVSLEPHLQLSSGLNSLVGRAFKNPYQYADEKSAFADAVEKFREII